MIEEERAARYSDLFAAKHDHGENCSLCPICATIGVLRTTKPEVLEHLAAAAKELIAVASLLLDEASEVVASAEKTADSPPDARSTGKIRRIDIQ